MFVVSVLLRGQWYLPVPDRCLLKIRLWFGFAPDSMQAVQSFDFELFPELSCALSADKNCSRERRHIVGGCLALAGCSNRSGPPLGTARQLVVEDRRTGVECVWKRFGHLGPEGTRGLDFRSM